MKFQYCYVENDIPLNYYIENDKYYVLQNNFEFEPFDYDECFFTEYKDALHKNIEELINQLFKD